MGLFSQSFAEILVEPLESLHEFGVPTAFGGMKLPRLQADPRFAGSTCGSARDLKSTSGRGGRTMEHLPHTDEDGIKARMRSDLTSQVDETVPKSRPPGRWRPSRFREIHEATSELAMGRIVRSTARLAAVWGPSSHRWPAPARLAPHSHGAYTACARGYQMVVP